LRAAIFIDGGYFFNHLRGEGGTLDYDRLGQYLLAPLRKNNLPVDLLRAYFYYCAPWMSEKPDPDELRRMDSHRSLVDEIERTNRWQVRLGKLEKRWDGNKEYFEQKRVDVLLSVDMVRHAAAGHIQHAIVIAGDSDFIPAIAAAKESGVTVSLWGGPAKTVHKDLAWLVDEIRPFDWSDFMRKGEVPRNPIKTKTRSSSAREGNRERKRERIGGGR